VNTALWILQGTLAALFLTAGLKKLLQPKKKLETKMGWVNDFSPGSVKTIGLLEILVGLGLILPGVLQIAPLLTTWAASGLVVLMIGAAVTHARRKEPLMIVPALILATLAAVAALGRFDPYAL
jgi:uncharacterized membrane protein YphA (DoxX/SURF4 family)